MMALRVAPRMWKVGLHSDWPSRGCVQLWSSEGSYHRGVMRNDPLQPALRHLEGAAKSTHTLQIEHPGFLKKRSRSPGS